MLSAVVWFEIPTSNFERAKKFYEALLAVSLMPMESPGRQMAAFPANWAEKEIGGCIVHGQGATPSATGTVVFLNCEPDLAKVLARVDGAGGSVLMPKTQIPMDGAGFMALIKDTEGNSVGLHSLDPYCVGSRRH